MDLSVEKGLSALIILIVASLILIGYLEQNKREDSIPNKTTQYSNQTYDSNRFEVVEQEGGYYESVD